ncbi:hypothetical protein [Lactococcus lactis]|uniref:Uncharacterized protein n=1 Tax=Lactococcus lactis subsp. lactis TaxID=1360 RepID=A0A0V8E3Q3_LACLL|nr:hypothetical protein [Lactococcus lactis]KSU20380.1 hypothetical protein M20_1545 [Lactococcus lactis subsp. lactis]
MEKQSNFLDKIKIWEIGVAIIGVVVSGVIAYNTASSVSNSNYKNNFTSSIINYKVSQLQELNKYISDYITLVSTEQDINKNIKFKIDNKKGNKIINLDILNADNAKNIKEKTTEINQLKNKIILSLDVKNESYKTFLSQIKNSGSYIKDSSLSRDLGLSNYLTTEELFLEDNDKNILVDKLSLSFKKYEENENNYIDSLIKE